MSGSVNKWIGIGNVCQDPEVRYTGNGDPVTNFTVACNESYKNKQGENVEQTEFVRIVCFQKLAELAEKYLRKGSKVYLEGKLQTRSWEKDGVKRYSTEIIARQIQFLDSKAEREAAEGHNYEKAAQADQRSLAMEEDSQDIPF